MSKKYVGIDFGYKNVFVPMTNPSDNAKEIRNNIRNILSNSTLDSYRRGITKQSDNSEFHEKYVDQILFLITAQNQQLLEEVRSKLPKYAEKAYYTKYPVLWKPIAPESNAEHYDAGFNEAIDQMNQALKEIEREIKL